MRQRQGTSQCHKAHGDAMSNASLGGQLYNMTTHVHIYSTQKRLRSIEQNQTLLTVVCFSTRCAVKWEQTLSLNVFLWKASLIRGKSSFKNCLLCFYTLAQSNSALSTPSPGTQVTVDMILNMDIMWGEPFKQKTPHYSYTFHFVHHMRVKAGRSHYR